MSSALRLLVHAAPGVLTQAALQTLETGTLLLTPNHRMGLELQFLLSEPLERTTLTSLARALLQELGWQPWTSGEAEAVVAGLLRSLSLQYLEPVSTAEGTVTVVRRFLGELHRANVSPARFREAASTPREHDLALIYAAYTALAQRERRFDASSAEYFAVTQRLSRRRALVHGFAYLDAAQIAFLSRFLAPGSTLTLPCSADSGTARTSRTRNDLLRLGWTLAEASGNAERVGDRAALTFVQCTPVPDSLTFGAYPNIEEEVRACVRQVRTWLAQGTPPEQILLIVRQEALYLETLRDVAEECGLPLCSGQRRALKHTPLGELLQRFLAAQEADWRFSETQALLSDPLLRPRFDLQLLLAHFHKVRPADGLQVWPPRLQWLQVPDQSPWRDVLHEHLHRFFWEFQLQGLCRIDPELNQAATALFGALQAEMHSSEVCTRADYLQKLRQVLADVRVPTLSRRAGILVVNALGAVGLTSEKVWILGLAQGIFPQSRQDHPLIDLHDRARLRTAGVDLPDVTQLQGVEAAQFHLALSVASRELVLSAPQRDLQGQPLSLSPYLDRFPNLPAPPTLPLASKLESSLQEMGHGLGTKSRQRRAQIERERHHRMLLGSYCGDFGKTLTVGGRPWSLPDLAELARCPFRWLVMTTLGLPQAITVEWLQASALRVACRNADASPVERLALALEQLDRFAARHPEHDSLLNWSLTRLDLQKVLEEALYGDVLQRPGDTPLKPAETVTFLLTSEPRPLHLQLSLDRLDQTPEGKRLTLYGPVPTSFAQGWLAAGLQTSGADYGSWYDPATNRRSYFLRQGSSLAHRALTELESHLHCLDAKLSQGQVLPTPSYAACQGCKVASVCRASHHRGAA